jgi:hypothetical protein
MSVWNNYKIASLEAVSQGTEVSEVGHSETTNKENTMKKFMFLHFGFEQPTPAIMEAWEKWFESIADKEVDRGGFNGGREVSKDGINDLPWDIESITGYNIIEAEDLDAAVEIAQANPYIDSIRVYELREM